MIDIIYKTTSSCNANCSYCFDKPAQNNKNQVMPVKDFLEMFEYLCTWNEDFEWCWHGGEPTLAGLDWFKEVLYGMQMLIMKYDLSIGYTIQTNGILLDDEWTKLFDKYNIQVSMSADGVENLKSRKYNANLDYINSVSSLYIINPFNINRLIEDYKISNQNRVVCSRNFVFPHRDDITTDDIWDNKTEEVIDKYIEYLKYYIFDINGRSFDRNAVDWAMESLGKHVDTCVFGNCWETNLFGLDYNGIFYKCDEIHRKETVIGYYKDFHSVEELSQSENVQKQFKNREEWLKTTCKNCDFIKHCQQGCYTRSLGESNGKEPYKFQCLCTKKIIPVMYDLLSDLSPEDMMKINPIIRDKLISYGYVPVSIKKRMKEYENDNNS